MPRQQSLKTLASEVIARMELRRQQQALQLTNEELRTANESLQMVNQDLLTANVTLHHITQQLEGTNLRLVDANQQVARLMEERLVQRETQFRELTESITHMFFAVDAELRFLYWNRACEQFTGKPVHAVIGTPLFELYPSLRGSRTERMIRQVLEKNKPLPMSTTTAVGNSILKCTFSLPTWGSPCLSRIWAYPVQMDG